MSILESVVYAHKTSNAEKQRQQQQRNQNPTLFSRKYAAEMADRPVEEVDPLRFKKLPGEKDQLKEMKSMFIAKHLASNPQLTNKQIMASFSQRTVITL